jgi:hypothetical protein
MTTAFHLVFEECFTHGTQFISGIFFLREVSRASGRMVWVMTGETAVVMVVAMGSDNYNSCGSSSGGCDSDSDDENATGAERKGGEWGEQKQQNLL